MATPKGKLKVQCQAEGDDITLTYDPVTLKPKERIALLHVCAQRNSIADAEAFAKKLNWAAVLRELDKGDRVLVRNVRADSGLLSLGGVDLFRGIDFPYAELRTPLVTLTDGSSFTALPQQRQLELKTAGGATVQLDAGRLAAIFFRPAEDLMEAGWKEEERDIEQPMLPVPYAELRLMNQDVFCGTLAGADDLITFETPFGTQRVGVHQVMRLKPRKTGAYSVRVTLWDGNVFPAQPVENLLRFTTNGGAKLEVPFGMLELYWRPMALPPAEEVTHIEGLIARLGDNDPQTREEAQKALAETGHGARALLAKHWKDKDLERRTRVRRLMEQLHESAPKETLEDE
jgi:hypothetical protein